MTETLGHRDNGIGLQTEGGDVVPLSDLPWKIGGEYSPVNISGGGRIPVTPPRRTGEQETLTLSAHVAHPKQWYLFEQGVGPCHRSLLARTDKFAAEYSPVNNSDKARNRCSLARLG